LAEPGVEQKLAAILAADVAGYTRLMAGDEPATIVTITEYRSVFRRHIEANSGRVVDMAGDSVLAIFTSAAGAVKAAVEVQIELAKRNEALGENRRMLFRVGVNLGDIREADDGTVYGDGVNVAARLEGLAEPGGIMISEDAHRQVRRNPELAFADVGLHEVKNIAEPVRAYRLLEPGAVPQRASRRRAALLSALAGAVLVFAGIATWQYMQAPAVETASVERMAFPLPEEPSIAVLPFDNLSASDEHNFIADGLSENIISALSQTRGMLVIARNSTFTYKGTAVKVQEVAEALGVRYVLEGSIQVVGERLRATAQLVDALSGNHLWSERYDRAVDDVFAVQDDITLNVVTALQVQLTEGPHALVWRGGTESLEAWSLFQRGREHLLRMTSAELAEARRLFEKAVAVDPTFALALAQIGNTHRLEVLMGFSASPEESLDEALSYAEQAVAIDQDSSDAHVVLAFVLRLRHDFKRAIEQVEIALRLGPNHGYVLGMAAVVLSQLGHTERAIALIEQAMRLSPNHLWWYPVVIAESHLLAGRHQMALDALQVAKADVIPRWQANIRIAALGGLGRDEEARRAVAERLEVAPTFSIALQREWLEGPAAFAPEAVATYVSLLRAAGVPEHPPGAEPSRPVIAVLPFDNLSGDLEQDYFADGITEDIITNLSLFDSFDVIARNSSFQYRDSAVDIRRVGEALSANYVLEGSVRRDGNSLRVTAQLVDTLDGSHLWAKRFDRSLNVGAIFEIQDQIASEIAGTLGGAHGVITETGVAEARRKPPETLASYECVLLAQDYMRTLTSETHLSARNCLERAVAREPDYADALAWLAFLHDDTYVLGFNPIPEPLEQARAVLQRALILDPRNQKVHWEMAVNRFFRRDLSGFFQEVEQALAINPNNAHALGDLALFMVHAGEPEKALKMVEEALRLDPIPRFQTQLALYVIYFQEQRFQQALSEITKTPLADFYWYQASLAAAYGQLDETQRAHDAAAALLALNPEFPANVWQEIDLWWFAEDVGPLIARYIAGLRKAGLDIPDHSN
jgi:adenylate cyclase